MKQWLSVKQGVVDGLHGYDKSVNLEPQVPRHANVVGLGLIGGSLCLALKENGFIVHGTDSDPSRADIAIERGIIDDNGIYEAADIGFVATPVAASFEAITRLLDAMTGFVTDVGSVKNDIVTRIHSERFVGGHPMAGSELDGLDGADATMFEGAVWVLTPSDVTSDPAFAAVAGIISRLGADVVALAPQQHDELVALISHVPHLTAATLMGLADERSEEHLALLRLAAGGFRDMTRIASGRTDIWLDICQQNRTAIVSALDSLIAGLTKIRQVVQDEDRPALRAHLDRARQARMNLPSRVGPSAELAEVRIPIPDRPGAAANVFALAGELGVNIFDFEVVHSLEGDRGIIVMVVDNDQVDLFKGGLLARKFRPAVHRLS